MVKTKAGCQKFKQILDQKQFDPAVLGEVQFPVTPYELKKTLFYSTVDLVSCWKNLADIELMPCCSVR